MRIRKPASALSFGLALAWVSTRICHGNTTLFLPFTNACLSYLAAIECWRTSWPPRESRGSAFHSLPHGACQIQRLQTCSRLLALPGADGQPHVMQLAAGHRPACLSLFSQLWRNGSCRPSGGTTPTLGWTRRRQAEMPASNIHCG